MQHLGGEIHYAEEDVFLSSRPLALTPLTANSQALSCLLLSQELFFLLFIPSVMDVIYFSGLGIREEVATHCRTFQSVPRLKQSVKYEVITMQT